MMLMAESANMTARKWRMHLQRGTLGTHMKGNAMCFQAVAALRMLHTARHRVLQPAYLDAEADAHGWPLCTSKPAGHGALAVPAGTGSALPLHG